MNRAKNQMKGQKQEKWAELHLRARPRNQMERKTLRKKKKIRILKSNAAESRRKRILMFILQQGGGAGMRRELIGFHGCGESTEARHYRQTVSGQGKGGQTKDFNWR